VCARVRVRASANYLKRKKNEQVYVCVLCIICFRRPVRYGGAALQPPSDSRLPHSIACFSLLLRCDAFRALWFLFRPVILGLAVRCLVALLPGVLLHPFHPSILFNRNKLKNLCGDGRRPPVHNGGSLVQPSFRPSLLQRPVSDCFHSFSVDGRRALFQVFARPSGMYGPDG